MYATFRDGDGRVMFRIKELPKANVSEDGLRLCESVGANITVTDYGTQVLKGT